MKNGVICVLITVLSLSFTGPVRAQSSPGEPVDPTGLSDPIAGREVTNLQKETEPPTGPPEPAPSELESQPDAPTEIHLSDALIKMVQLVRAGVEEEILLNYINTSTEPFEIDSEEIIYLTDLGAQGNVINAMIERDRQLSGTDTQALPSFDESAELNAGVFETDFEASDLTVPDEEEQLTVDYFQSYLSPYGSWVDIPGYGLCWQPTVCLSSSGWSPYVDRGRWLYTDYGWYWYSDYSWGWATFHYGRWLNHSRWGWCWYPGTVWGPSWVTWTYSYPYSGWAPLPPYSRSGFYFSAGISWGIPSWCYTYVPCNRVWNYYPRTCAVPYARARGIHGKARHYNRYGLAGNNTIMNRGIPPEKLANGADTEIRRTELHERRTRPSGRSRGESMGRNGETLTVHRPQPASTRRNATANNVRRTSPRSTIRGSGTEHPTTTATGVTPRSSTSQRTNPYNGQTRRTRGNPVNDPNRSGATVHSSSASTRFITSTAQRTSSSRPNVASVGTLGNAQPTQTVQPSRSPRSSLVIIRNSNTRTVPTTQARSRWQPTSSRTVQPSRLSSTQSQISRSSPSSTIQRSRSAPVRSAPSYVSPPRSTTQRSAPTRIAPVAQPTRSLARPSPASRTQRIQPASPSVQRSAPVTTRSAPSRAQPAAPSQRSSPPQGRSR